MVPILILMLIVAIFTSHEVVADAEGAHHIHVLLFFLLEQDHLHVVVFDFHEVRAADEGAGHYEGAEERILVQDGDEAGGGDLVDQDVVTWHPLRLLAYVKFRVTTSDHVPLGGHSDEDLVVAEPGALLECDALMAHSLIVPLVVAEQVRHTNVDKHQVFQDLALLNDQVILFKHLGVKLSDDLSNEDLGRHDIVLVVVEEELDPVVHVGEHRFE
mmetsp:Transcript_37788/g.45981  ORF Transcript_37788/g.45981 Transcript_37788/m.45981 type:complete len:215 (-) Transcript_37788:2438-3082(-)|eukprot:CAMPEP_0170462358 /NCGR_PEP_ID=MMETSP0123-20130129/7894_1 /TAXON_ID=182087 /ORGANISM="Favella ehrenbergii, Strain Fehren 1" /LENGTH=214 /DNA_ID=CAMNT_0010727559 /DNA_START=942 /DNA_END=1586 /DNA_ORIENTATION=-